MSHLSTIRMLATVAPIVGGALWGLVGFLIGKHSRAVGWGIMLFGVGVTTTGFGQLISATWLRITVIGAGIFLELCGVVVGATAVVKRRKYDREQSLHTAARY